MVVSDNCEQPLQRLGETLKERGCDVYTVPDVYAAMAYLARGVGADFVLLDGARLDRQEAEFLVLAPQYFDRTRLLYISDTVAPHRDGAAHPRAWVASIEQMLQSVLAVGQAPTAEPQDARGPEDYSVEHPAEWPEAQALDLGPVEAAGDAGVPANGQSSDAGEAAGQAAEARVDTGTVALPTEPALHDAVRQRMAEFRPPTVSRTPPKSSGGEPFAEGAVAHAAGSPRDLVTPEELDALLDGGNNGIPRSGGEAR